VLIKILNKNKETLWETSGSTLKLNFPVIFGCICIIAIKKKNICSSQGTPPFRHPTIFCELTPRKYIIFSLPKSTTWPFWCGLKWIYDQWSYWSYNIISISFQAGTGKTFLLKEVILQLKLQGKAVAVTASTGWYLHICRPIIYFQLAVMIEVNGVFVISEE